MAFYEKDDVKLTSAHNKLILQIHSQTEELKVTSKNLQRSAVM